MHPTHRQRALPRSLAPFLLLATALLLASCSETPSLLKPGPRFVRAAEVPSHLGQVYIYWPIEERSSWSNLMVGPCEEVFLWVQPGAYARAVVRPGRRCFRTEGNWEMRSVNAFGSMEMASLDLDVAAGQTLFLRVEKRGVLPGMILRPVEPAKAETEIRHCGEMIPMSEEEVHRVLQARGE